MAFRLLLFISLLTENTGFSANISVFVQTGDSVQLDIQTQKLPEFDQLSWINDKSQNIVKYIRGTKEVKPHSSYKDRVHFNDETFSLTLKNTQKTDSGLYTARTSGESDETIVTYRVSVIGAVEDPVLTVNSNWFSGNSCTVNFTCRAHDLMTNSSYQNNRCSTEEVTSQINTLILHCSEESIICNHSNPVSWKKDRINITQLCVKGLGAGCLLVGICLYCKCKKGVPEADSTVYAQVEVQYQTEKETGDNRPETTYCTVGQHQNPVVPVETTSTIYLVVCKQSTKKPPTISSDDA
ncbi:SLAM family member 9-like [Pimephales promelas]|nr:SLAM family member 9-like [Pimephales promelas]